MDELKLRTDVIEIKLKHKYYGYKRVTQHLKNNGIHINKKRIFRIMKLLKLIGIRKRKKRFESITKIAYIDSKFGINIIRDIKIEKPYQVLHTDFTELITAIGKFYLMVYLCNFSKIIAGWAIGYRANTELAIKCLNPVLKYLFPSSYIHHDQGSVYISNDYTDKLIKADVFISYSQKGTPSDNGEVESFFSHFKNEWEEEYFYAKNFNHLKSIINKAMNYYNKERIHSALNKAPWNFFKGLTTSLKTV